MVIAGPDECWLWTGALSGGYGMIGLEGSKIVGAHRVAWFFATGDWAELVEHYVCDNPPCQNPAHLKDGTKSSNALSMSAHGRSNHAPKTTCPAGHPYDMIYVRTEPRSDGSPQYGRGCSECRREANRRHEATRIRS